MSKTIKTRIIQKHAVEANWLKAVNFVPMVGEIIVYDPDEAYEYSRFKVGDGVKTVTELPFVDAAILSAAKQYTNEQIAAIPVLTSDDALDLLYSMNYISPAASSDNTLYADNNNKLFVL